MKFTNKLHLVFGSLMVLLMFISGTALYMLSNFKNDMTTLVENRYEKVRLANVIRNEINNTRIFLLDLILDKNKDMIGEDFREIENARVNTLVALDSLDKLVNSQQVNELISRLRMKNSSYLNFQLEIENLVKSGRQAEAIRLFQDKSPEYRNYMFPMINQIEQVQEQIMRDTIAQTNNSYHNALNVLISSLILSSFILIGVFTITMRKVSVNINKVTNMLNSISSFDAADSLPRIQISSKDEIGNIAKAFNEMAGTLEKQLKQEKQYNQEIQEQNWLKTTLAEISTSFQGIRDIKIFGELLISKIAPKVGGSYGVFYLINKHGEQAYLQRISTYAADNQALDCREFNLGEGLVGQCALENKTILLTQVPDNYIKISSGLGETTPTNLIILPVEFEGKVSAVIELASLEEFTPIQQELLNQVLKDSGITINRIENHMQVEKLLKESQVMTEELQTQAEELQLQQEELKTFNEKIEEQFKESQQKAVELEKAKLALEEKAEQLVLSSRYKSEFLSNMSHELRTPLNSLLVLAQILAENASANLTPKQVEYAETIMSSGQDLVNLINDILDLAKVEAGKMDVYPAEVKLEDIKAFVERVYVPLAHKMSLKFDIQLDHNLPESIYTEEHKLQQILKNLLSNAFKFTEQGSVQVKISRVANSSYSDRISSNPILAIAVTDTGIGIPQEKHSVIFEEFRQADGTTNRKYGGTGLGLSISQKIAALLGGFIELQSQEGEGSTFTLYLPLRLPDKIVEESSKTPIASGQEQDLSIDVKQCSNVSKNSEVISVENNKDLLKGRKILIVDDDMRNVFALTAVLENHKMDVLFAENGKSGIEALQENRGIDLVLMDIMMPEMDGYEAIKNIREIADFQTLPIIALTAKAMKYDREKCINAGASDYISKPVNLEQLISLIKVWLYK